MISSNLLLEFEITFFSITTNYFIAMVVSYEVAQSVVDYEKIKFLTIPSTVERVI